MGSPNPTPSLDIAVVLAEAEKYDFKQGDEIAGLQRLALGMLAVKNDRYVVGDDIYVEAGVIATAGGKDVFFQVRRYATPGLSSTDISATVFDRAASLCTQLTLQIDGKGEPKVIPMLVAHNPRQFDPLVRLLDDGRLAVSKLAAKINTPTSEAVPMAQAIQSLGKFTVNRTLRTKYQAGALFRQPRPLRLLEQG